jgi:hypothetical protein
MNEVDAGGLGESYAVKCSIDPAAAVP